MKLQSDACRQPTSVDFDFKRREKSTVFRLALGDREDSGEKKIILLIGDNYSIPNPAYIY